MVGQGPSVLAAGAWRIGYVIYILSSFSNASSVDRIRLDILKYCGLGRYNPAVAVTTGGVLAKYC